MSTYRRTTTRSPRVWRVSITTDTAAEEPAALEITASDGPAIHIVIHGTNCCRCSRGGCHEYRDVVREQTWSESTNESRSTSRVTSRTTTSRLAITTNDDEGESK